MVWLGSCLAPQCDVGPRAEFSWQAQKVILNVGIARILDTNLWTVVIFIMLQSLHFFMSPVAYISVVPPDQERKCSSILGAPGSTE